MYEIEKGVPLPEGAGKERQKYPFGEMRPGDSFFVPGGATVNAHGNKSAYSAASNYGRAHGWKFSARTVTENGVKGVRIWRIA